MNKKEQINKLIEEALTSADNVKRANPLPFLQTRVNARINKSGETTWEKAGWFIGRPSFAIMGLAILIFINGMAVVLNKSDILTVTNEQPAQDPADEFSYSVATFYDNENIEP